MNRKNNLRIIYFSSFIFVVALVFFVSSKVFAVEVRLIVAGCNNNAICEADLGENTSTCSADCPLIPVPTPTPSPTPASSATPIPLIHVPTVGSQIKPIILSDIKVVPDINSAAISWITDRNARGMLQWGTTPDYELGGVQEDVASTAHSITISNLARSTRYYFKLTAVSPSNFTSVSYYQASFMTLRRPANEPPVNVSDFSAVYKNQNVVLTWNVPLDADVDEIKILRSQNFYSKDPFEGRIIYEGQGNYVSDSNVALGSTYYYTAYVRGINGIYSSGAIVKISLPGKAGDLPVYGISETPGYVSSIKFSDFIFKEDEQLVTPSGDSVTVSPGSEVSISIDKNKVPGKIKFLYALFSRRDNDAVALYTFGADNDLAFYKTRVGMFSPDKTYYLEFRGVDIYGNEFLLAKGAIVVKNLAVQNPAPFYWLWFFLLLLLLAVVLYVVAEFIRGDIKIRKRNF